jgi:hypothetical protein
MKKADIKPGVVYACWRRKAHESPSPIMFLAAPSPDALYHRARGGDETAPCFARALAHDKPQREEGWQVGTIGYPAAMRGSDSKLAPEDLLNVTLADFEAATSSQQGGYRFTLVCNLAEIAGPWDEEVAWDRERHRRRDERIKQELAAADASRARAADILTALRAHGVEANRIPTYSAVDSITLPLDEAEKLIALLAAKDEWGYGGAGGDCAGGVWQAGTASACVRSPRKDG